MDSQLRELITSGTPGVTLNISAADLKEIVVGIMHNERKRAEEDIERQREIPTLTREQTAKMLNISICKLDRITKNGEIASCKIGVNVRYRLSDVEKYIDDVNR